MPLVEAQAHLLQVAGTQHIRESALNQRGTAPSSTVTLLNAVAFHQSWMILVASPFAEFAGPRQDVEND